MCCLPTTQYLRSARCLQRERPRPSSAMHWAHLRGTLTTRTRWTPTSRRRRRQRRPVATAPGSASGRNVAARIPPSASTCRPCASSLSACGRAARRLRKRTAMPGVTPLRARRTPSTSLCATTAARSVRQVRIRLVSPWCGYLCDTTTRVVSIRMRYQVLPTSRRIRSVSGVDWQTRRTTRWRAAKAACSSGSMRRRCGAAHTESTRSLTCRVEPVCTPHGYTSLPLAICLPLPPPPRMSTSDRGGSWCARPPCVSLPRSLQPLCLSALSRSARI